MTQNYISKDGLEKAKKELEELKSIKRPEVIERIASARELGDLSENAEYHDAREEQGFVEGRIRELENIVTHALIIDNKAVDVVVVGSTISATCDNGNQLKYTIVGYGEADPVAGKISNESPLGQAFIGKKVGEDVELNIPAGKIKCKIDKVE